MSFRHSIKSQVQALCSPRQRFPQLRALLHLHQWFLHQWFLHQLALLHLCQRFVHLFALLLLLRLSQRSAPSHATSDLHHQQPTKPRCGEVIHHLRQSTVEHRWPRSQPPDESRHCHWPHCFWPCWRLPAFFFWSSLPILHTPDHDTESQRNNFTMCNDWNLQLLQ